MPGEIEVFWVFRYWYAPGTAKRFTLLLVVVVIKSYMLKNVSKKDNFVLVMLIGTWHYKNPLYLY